jgi:HEAT repeat protein
VDLALLKVGADDEKTAAFLEGAMKRERRAGLILAVALSRIKGHAEAALPVLREQASEERRDPIARGVARAALARVAGKLPDTPTQRASEDLLLEIDYVEWDDYPSPKRFQELALQAFDKPADAVAAMRQWVALDSERADRVALGVLEQLAPRHPAALEALLDMACGRGVGPMSQELFGHSPDGTWQLLARLRFPKGAAPVLARALESLLRAEDARHGPRTSRDFQYDRRFAARDVLKLIGLLGPEAAPAIPVLKRCLKDPELRPTALETLGWIGKAAVPVLVEELRGSQGDALKDVSAAFAIAGPEAEAAVPALVAEVQAHSGEAAQLVADALALIGPAAKQPLVEIARTGPPARRVVAVRALASMGSFGAEPLAALLDDERQFDEVRLAAAKGLSGAGRAGAAVAVPALVRALDSRDEELRLRALDALGKLGPAAAPAVPRLMKPLADWLKTASPPPAEKLGSGFFEGPWPPGDGMKVVDVLERIGPDARPALPVLVKLLACVPEKPVGEALCRIGPDAACVPPLLKTLDSKSWRLASMAGQALFAVRPDVGSALPAVLEALESPQLQVRVHAAILAARMGPAAKEAVPRLRKLLGEKNSYAPASAAFALVQIGEAARPALEDLRSARSATRDDALREVLQAAIEQIEAGD